MCRKAIHERAKCKAAMELAGDLDSCAKAQAPTASASRAFKDPRYPRGRKEITWTFQPVDAQAWPRLRLAGLPWFLLFKSPSYLFAFPKMRGRPRIISHGDAMIAVPATRRPPFLFESKRLSHSDEFTVARKSSPIGGPLLTGRENDGQQSEGSGGAAAGVGRQVGLGCGGQKDLRVARQAPQCAASLMKAS